MSDRKDDMKIAGGVVLLACALGAILLTLGLARSQPFTGEVDMPQAKDAPWADVDRKVLGSWFETLHQEFESEDVDGESGYRSCCGLGDAYEADIIETSKDGKELYAIITDGREFCYTKHYGKPDGQDATRTACRKDIPEGTRLLIPQKTRINRQGNPSGHGVVFISQADLKTVFCFVTGALN